MPLAGYADRHRSCDILLRTVRDRFVKPTWVETGTIRHQEDWQGTGFSTYWCGAFLHHYGGKLWSVDISAENCRFAKTWTAIFGESVEIVESDSRPFLQAFSQPIDVLYLDSVDTEFPHHTEHIYSELQAAMPNLHDQSLILIDDTPWHEGEWIGKGAKAVPWLLEHGWRIVYAGYQVLLTR